MSESEDASRPTGLRGSAQAARALAERTFERAQEKRPIRQAYESLRSEQRTGAALLSGGLAYRFFLWLVPFGLVVAAILSFWVRANPRGLDETARTFGLGGVAAHSATHAIEDGSRARWYLLIAGLALMAWSGLGAVRALRVAARIAWGVQADRLRRPLHATATFAIVGSIGLGASVGASWARHDRPALGLVVTLIDAVLFGLLALYAFLHLPHPAGTTWRTMWPGAVLTGAGLTAVHLFLGYYLAGRLERTPALYGALGASTVVLLVLFLIARLLVSALFLNATLERMRTEPGPTES